MFAAILAAAAVATAQAPSTPASAPSAQPKITAETPLTVTLPAAVLEAAKEAIHRLYPGDQADPVIKVITEQENQAVAKLTAPAKK